MVVSQHLVVRVLEAPVQVARGVALHVLQRCAGERQTADEPYEGAPPVPVRYEVFYDDDALVVVVVGADVLHKVKVRVQPLKRRRGGGGGRNARVCYS